MADKWIKVIEEELSVPPTCPMTGQAWVGVVEETPSGGVGVKCPVCKTWQWLTDWKGSQQFPEGLYFVEHIKLECLGG